jgi:hypothetical protein
MYENGRVAYSEGDCKQAEIENDHLQNTNVENYCYSAPLSRSRSSNLAVLMEVYFWVSEIQGSMRDHLLSTVINDPP